MATTEQTSRKGEIKFSIFKVINNINKSNISYSELGNELNNFKNHNNDSKPQHISESDIFRGRNDQDRDGTKSKQQHYTGHGRVSKKQRFLLR